MSSDPHYLTVTFQFDISPDMLDPSMREAVVEVLGRVAYERALAKMEERRKRE